MASVNYFLKGKTEPKGIYVRLRDTTIDLKVPTGYYIDSKYWNIEKTEKVKIKQVSEFKERKNLSKNLHDLYAHLFNKYNDEKGTGIILDANWINRQIELFKNPSKNDISYTLIGELEGYRNRLKNKVNLKTNRATSSGTIRNFNTTIYRVEQFQKLTNRTILLNEVDLTFHDEFTSFLSDKMNLSINSIGTSIKQIKTACVDARDRGLNINIQILSKKFNVIKEKTSFVTITESEIKSILNFKGANHLMNARDWLIIGLWTGCRVGDLMKLSTNNILTSTNGTKFIRYTQEKTGSQVDIPIHKDVDNILSLLKGFPRPISKEKFNEYIKTVCRESGLTYAMEGSIQNPNTHKKETGTFPKWKLISSHCCRRSFATNHYNKLSNKLIMAVTGHKSEKQFLQYIGETENNHVEDFLKAWGVQSEQAKTLRIDNFNNG